MKKVKTMLTAIIIIASVAGAFAFKSLTINGMYYCSNLSGDEGGICGTNATRYTDGAFPGFSLYCIVNPTKTTTPCPSTRTDYLVQDSY